MENEQILNTKDAKAIRNVEIKKALYKEKPKAVNITKSMNAKSITYQAETSIGKATFIIPIDEMGTERFEDIMEAQLLIRWIV